MVQVLSFRYWSSQPCSSSLSSCGLKLERATKLALSEKHDLVRKRYFQSDEDHHQGVVLFMARPLHYLATFFSSPWRTEVQKSRDQFWSYDCDAQFIVLYWSTCSMPSIILNPRFANPFWLSFRHHILWLQVSGERCDNCADQLALCPDGLTHFHIVEKKNTSRHILGFISSPQSVLVDGEKKTESNDTWIWITTSVPWVHVKLDDLTHWKSFLSFAATSV